MVKQLVLVALTVSWWPLWSGEASVVIQPPTRESVALAVNRGLAHVRSQLPVPNTGSGSPPLYGLAMLAHLAAGGGPTDPHHGLWFRLALEASLRQPSPDGSIPFRYGGDMCQAALLWSWSETSALLHDKYLYEKLTAARNVQLQYVKRTYGARGLGWASTEQTVGSLWWLWALRCEDKLGGSLTAIFPSGFRQLSTTQHANILRNPAWGPMAQLAAPTSATASYFTLSAAPAWGQHRYGGAVVWSARLLAHHQGDKENAVRLDERVLRLQLPEGAWELQNEEKNFGSVYATCLAILSLTCAWEVLPSLRSE